MIRHILAPLDGSLRAETILPHVSHLASVFGARVDLVNVVSARGSGGGDRIADPLGRRLARAERIRYLEARARELRKAGLEVTTLVEEGGAAEVIVDLLARGSYDLVGLTPHGTGDDRHLMVGCTASAIILNARTSILMVPDAPGRSRDERPARASYRQVVAPVDCSPRSDWSLVVAAMIARSSGAGLRVVHVLDTPTVVSRLPDSQRMGRSVNRIVEANRDEAGRYLDQVVWRLNDPGLQVESEVIESTSSPAKALRDLVSSNGGDLVVLSAHGWGASPEWSLGGTAAKLVFSAQRPVLILQDLKGARTGRVERVPRSFGALASES